MKDSAPSSVAGLQILRAFAALCVVCYHAPSELGGTFRVDIGTLGVQIFFVISGFLMEWTAPDTATANPWATSKAFLLRRVQRVVPLYWLATFALVALMLRGGVAVDWHHLLLSLAFIPHFAGAQPDQVVAPILVPGWTLDYEAFFYVSFALALLLGPARRLVLSAWLLALVLIGFVWQPQSAIGRTYTSVLLLGFLEGMAVACLVRWRGFPRGVAAVLMPAGLLPFIVGPFQGQGLAEVIGAGAILAGSLALRWPQAAWTRALVFLGDASYSIYLWHTILLGGVTRRIVQPLAGRWGWNWGVEVLAVFVICTLIGTILHVLLERPVLRWLRGARPRPRP